MPGKGLGLLVANDLVIHVDAAATDPLDRSSRTDEKYEMMVVIEEAVVTFKTTWLTATGEAASEEFTEKTLAPGNYPGTIYDVTVASGEVWLLV